MTQLSGARQGDRKRPVVARLSLVWFCALGAACGTPAAPLSDTAPSSLVLAQAVADALYARDRPRLETLALSEAEFRHHIWPKLPASRPEVGMPTDYVWADTSAKSRAYLLKALDEYGGRRMTVEEVTFDRRPTDYGSFRVYPEAHLRLRDGQGLVTSARLFGSMVESGGSWKVYSYIVD
jgi:hypothetical protein